MVSRLSSMNSLIPGGMNHSAYFGVIKETDSQLFGKSSSSSSSHR